MQTSPLYEQALAFATRYHEGQVRKNALAEPYITHPVGVAQLLMEAGITDEIVLAAALLHDTVEDTAATDALVRAEFGDEVADVVAEVTDDKSLPKEVRKCLQVVNAHHKSWRAALVKAADKLHNLRDMVDSPPRGWSIGRIRGYWVWAKRVVDVLKIDNAWLVAELNELFATATIETVEGDSSSRVPIIPQTTEEQQVLYTQYLAHMAEPNIAK
jgi:guanosine-3',5'-bis(diphosphate) 3'-pyrophosphohydrolase